MLSLYKDLFQLNDLNTQSSISKSIIDYFSIATAPHPLLNYFPLKSTHIMLYNLVTNA